MKSFEDDQDYTFLVTVTANDLKEAEQQVPFDSILYAVNGDTRFQTKCPNSQQGIFNENRAAGNQLTNWHMTA